MLPEPGAADCRDRPVLAGDFHHWALMEAVRELSGVIQPRRVLEKGLLAAMGPLGALRGACLFSAPGLGVNEAVGRGLSSESLEALAEAGPFLAGLADSDTPSALVAGDDHRLASLGGLPPKAVVVPWRAGPEFGGALVLGERARGVALDQSEERLALQIAAFMAGTMRIALATRRISQLNADLYANNQSLEQALEANDQVRAELDRKVYHLAGLNELGAELAGLNDMRSMLDGFLLPALGSLRASWGWIMVLDRDRGRAMQAARGVDEPPLPEPDRAESLLYGCLDRGKGLAGLGHMRATPLLDPPEAARQAGLDKTPWSGSMFMVEPGLMGLCLFGPGPGGEPLGQDEKDLMATQLSSLMAYLKNARSFEDIRDLNRDLERRNEELTRTIRDLTEARQRIGLLEEIQRRMRQALAWETARMGRATWVDYLAIVLVSVVVALLFNAVSPNGIPLAPEHLFAFKADIVTPAEAADLEGAMVVDARPAEMFRQGHLPGAVNAPPGFFDMVYMMKMADTDLDVPVLVYGRTVSSRYDLEAAMNLARRDHERVYVLDGGLDAWRGRGLPVTEAQ